jgi:glycosyltransferase involved in cell wall biosynthesis
MSAHSTNHRLLVFDCHEAWVYQLHLLEQPMDVIVGLKGRHTTGWDAAIRPVPPNARIVELPEALAAEEPYDCIIAHNLTDLLDVKALCGPRLFVVHGTLNGIVLEQASKSPPDEVRRTVARYLQVVGAHVMSVSRLKASSWALDGDIVPLSADSADYLPYRGDLARGLRIANHIHRRARTLRWDFHERAFAQIPITLVGHNDDMPGVCAARDWAELKQTLSRHRFFVHTADPQLEDGYNMATLEAMAAGLPVLGNRHPTSPIVHGVSGFLSDDPEEIRGFAQRLLEERDLAVQMGREAQKTVIQKFSPEKFKNGVQGAIETARQKWLAHQDSGAISKI